MKKTTIAAFIMLFAFSTLLTVKASATVVVAAETPASCAAGTDLDGDDLTGAADSDCAAFGPSLASVLPGVETSASCSAGTDLDGDDLTGVTDPDCAAFASTTTVLAVTGAETAGSCLAGTDLDGDDLTGVADPDCAAFASTTQAFASLAVETPASCAAGIDLDGDDLTGVADPDCNVSTEATTTASVTGVSGPSFGGGGGGSSFGGGITSGTPVSAIATGTPISATGTEPICAEMLKTFMRKGKTNNVSEVKKLQGLLNKYLGLSLPTTGFFGNATHNAVKSFQLKYKDTILTPWGITAPTGYFYKTTQRQMNLLLCSTADIPMPVLN